MKTLEEIRQTESAKLLEDLRKLQKDLFVKKIEVRTNQAKDSHNIKKMKKKVAQIRTVLRERELKTNSSNQDINSKQQ